jgi:osmotically-inducible protein OsmY
MKSISTHSPLLPVAAGALAFLFASIPLSLGYALDGDRPVGDPQVQGNRSDAELKDQIKTALASDTDLSDSAKIVKVIATNGNVILKGMVATRGEAEKIEGIVHSISKTALIENDLKTRN